MVLSPEQVDEFWREGVLTVHDAVSVELLEALRSDFASWVEESRGHTSPYGEIIDGRKRFDLQGGHTAELPALRRVAAPTEISPAYFDAMADSPMTDMVADLIGPDVKLHHTKINSKLPGAATEVKWHQDFPYTPHTNTDVVTALLMVDEVTEENGPLEVLPGSHLGPIHSLWHDGRFTGAVADDSVAEMRSSGRTCSGPAGSVCLMHTMLAHGSAPNLSQLPRTLFIAVYSAGDAIPLTRNPVPTVHEGLFVRGSDPVRIRSTPFEVEVPEYPSGTSFFVQQEDN
ncbi:MAG TPA: phytanoyl-CoA dioxygenase family protein [Acidimicrobiales bacterium]|jgi:ectoine hydroxylase-related dioxygenase (phytanoyl-CoA dioxygenase family)|nr:phytanoyl-CoA dioxygenase family protein [Acidimicrobiales bacterium]MDP7209568.1 phytanoyl-CoA dioxygenase family protein [Acidimicrobiales bacterium]HJL89910.1 phytanoyl-CoA dioxygenase family protein [Acidimicrobiales bacterium]HJO98232.1 phytanoyl-CoA dioxygenase family protein [Acidimicrobiales bacterium]|tara:strand:- start:40877 stop:41734 length:858 start_codon:yes stop_codon:yes gene_type:complete